jgi:hypothetical protein
MQREHSMAGTPPAKHLLGLLLALAACHSSAIGTSSSAGQEAGTGREDGGADASAGGERGLDASGDLRKVCIYNGKTYAVGQQLPGDGCTSCYCREDGYPACSTNQCPARDAATEAPAAAADGGDGPTASCSFDRTYKFHYDGGLRAFADSSTLSARNHTVSRDRHDNAPRAMCTRELPCQAADGKPSVREVMTAIGHPDVVAALMLASKPLYGGDPRPMDGVVFVFERDDGRGFMVGPGMVPPGLRALEQLLASLQTETIASPSCANLRN